MSQDMTKTRLDCALEAIKRHHKANQDSFVTAPDGLYLELMVHPGYPCISEVGGCGGLSGPDQFARSNDRLGELEFLISTEAFTFVSDVTRFFELLNCQESE